jgi:RNA polymerase sigma factor (sigma-70 family)
VTREPPCDAAVQMTAITPMRTDDQHPGSLERRVHEFSGRRSAGDESAHDGRGLDDLLGEHPSGERLVEIGDRRSVGSDHAHDVVETDELWNRLATLPRKQRAVLVLRYYEQLSDAEIASLLSCAEVTVRSNASKPLATLRLQAKPRVPVAGEIR